MNTLSSPLRFCSPRRAPRLTALGVALSALLAAAVTLSPSSARADDHDDAEAFSIGPQPAWFLLGGVTGGLTIASDDTGGFIGGELSLVRLRAGRWLGLYAEGGYELGLSAPYIAAGPEVGWILFGLDGGAMVRFDDDGAQFGPQGRLLVSLGVFSIYGRYAYMLDVEQNQHVVHIGASLKFPLTSPFGQGPLVSNRE